MFLKLRPGSNTADNNPLQGYEGPPILITDQYQ